MLSSKAWMSLVAAGILLASTTSSNAQTTRYTNGQLLQQRQTQQPLSRTQVAQRNARSMSNAGYDQVAPPAPPTTHVARAYVPQHMQNSGIQTGVVVQQPAVQTEIYQEQVRSTRPVRVGSTTRGPIARTSQMISETPYYDGNMVGGSPVVGNTIVGGGILNSGCAGCGSSGYSTHTTSGGCSSCGNGGCGTGFGGPVDLGVGETYFDGGGCGDPGCGSGLSDCCGRGGCPPTALEECWLNGLFGVFSGGEFFGGGVGFRSEQFQVPGASVDDVFEDCSFGFYGGFNIGVPLCRLTCGLIQGQIGVRHVASEFDGNSFSANSRNQTFFTAGLFRRVDYGLQMGVVADVMREEWFADSQTVQLRGDIGWVYPSGSTFGFRFTSQLEDDVSDGVIDLLPFTGLTTTTIETYRFYYRHTAPSGGYTDFSAGWSDNEHFLIGFDHDMPISETIAIQSSLLYLSGEDLASNSPFAGNGNEAWNISVGFAWRPNGRAWYRSYNRPMFNVADNGTMILKRE